MALVVTATQRLSLQQVTALTAQSVPSVATISQMTALALATNQA